MTEKLTTSALQEHVEEIAALEAALRSGELTGQSVVEALRRLYELMEWQSDTAARAEIDYLFA